MARSLPYAAVSDNSLVRCHTHPFVKRAKFLEAFEGPVVVAGFPPGDVLRAGDVAPTLAGLGEVRRSQYFSRELLRAANVHEHRPVAVFATVGMDHRLVYLR